MLENLPLLLLAEARGKAKVSNLHSHGVGEEKVAQLEIPTFLINFNK